MNEKAAFAGKLKKKPRTIVLRKMRKTEEKGNELDRPAIQRKRAQARNIKGPVKVGGG